ncbi:MAG: enoyl-CoA hydratase-related protein [Bacteroidia bacterium]
MINHYIANNELITLSNIKAVLEEGIFTITLNRPDKLNALNHQTLSDLKTLIEDLNEHPEIRAVILTGAGEKAFVAGADIAELAHLNPAQAKETAQFGCDIFNTIEQSSKPFIAAINGFALGGGLELAMACHLRIASENSRFGQPEVNLGLTPGYSGTQRLTQLIGKAKSLELLMTADMITAPEALALGLVNHVVPATEVITKSKEILTKIMTKSPTAVKGVIACVNAYYTESVDGFEYEIQTFGNCFGEADFKEGVAAFLEKRKPAFAWK